MTLAVPPASLRALVLRDISSVRPLASRGDPRTRRLTTQTRALSCHTPGTCRHSGANSIRCDLATVKDCTSTAVPLQVNGCAR